MKLFFSFLLFSIAFSFVATMAVAAEPVSKPNIVFILCDDLGYGDVKCNNPEGKIATPRIDRLAGQGMRFTNAHTTSSVCTPTRYSLLTGRYNWRSRLQREVVGGFSARLIEPGRLTVAELLRQNGYKTACIGKWHLGMNWARKPDTKPFPMIGEKGPEGWNADFTKPITGGPNSVGFDYYFGISASLDMVPYAYIENDHITEIPTEDRGSPWILGQDKRVRRGPAAADFDAMEVLPTITRKATEYIANRKSSSENAEPFFLYLPLTSPHSPILPTPKWQGRSGLNYYADFVMQTDSCVGEVLDAIEKYGFYENTLVVVASDNGCAPTADMPTLAKHGHKPSYIYRGQKADIWDGGHRVPFVVRWPGKVKAGSVSDQMVSLVDWMASCADILQVTLPDNAAEDSISFLPVLLRTAKAPVRKDLVYHSINGQFSIRQGDWQLALCPGSGGWSSPNDAQARKRGLPPVQLYNMSEDPGQQENLQAKHPELVKSMTELLESYVARGRSTPGEIQKNDGNIQVIK